jgi:putative membrane protein
MKLHKPSVARGVATGIVAGIAATLVMDQFQRLAAYSHKEIDKHQKLAAGESTWQIAHEQAQQEAVAAQQEGSTEIVARKLASAVGKPLPEEEKKTAGQAVHFIFGTLMGVVYCVTAEIIPEAASGGGTAYGTLLFLGADEVAVPTLRLAPPPTQSAPTDHLQHWAAHIVYGGSLELVRSLLRKIF